MTGTLDTSIITPAEATGFAQAAYDTFAAQFPFAKILPEKSNGGTTLVSWEPNHKPKQNSFMFRTWDAEAPYGKTEGAGVQYYTELLPLAKRLRITEQDQIKGLESPTFLHDKLEQYFMQLGGEAAWRMESARVQAVINGAFKVEENGLKATYDYKRKAALTVDLAAKTWDTADADPVADVLSWIDAIKKADGIRPAAVVTSSDVLAALAMNKKVIEAFYARGAANDLPTRIGTDDVISVLKRYAQISEILVADDAYRAIGRDLDGGMGEFYPANTFVMVPALSGTTVGYTASGPTAEAADPSYQIGKSDNSGLIGAVFATTEPTGIEAYVDGSALPVLEQSNSTLAATVLPKA